MSPILPGNRTHCRQNRATGHPFFSRLLGGNRAKCAVARFILIIIWHLLASPVARFADLGPDWHDRKADHDRKIRAHLCQLHALIGTVSYISQRAAAEAAVAGLAGVRNVINDIEVSYVMDPANVDVNVQQALERSALVPAAT